MHKLEVGGVVDLIGKKIGHLTILEVSHRDAYSRRYYRCLCACSRETKTRRDYILENQGNGSLSCGCRTGLNNAERHKNNIDKRRRAYIKIQAEACVRARNNKLKQKYGINTKDYERMFQEQKGQCACCGRNAQQLPDANKKLCVDHCHTTGKVRALLCHGCNSALGLFKESVSSLESAIAYLKKHTPPQA